MAGTSEGGKKAAQTRGHKSLSTAGRKGGEARANRSRGKASKLQNKGERKIKDEK